MSSRDYLDIVPRSAPTDLCYSELQLAENPNPRCPVAVLLDTSSSMLGLPIAELNNGLRVFFCELMEDPVSRLAVEVVLISFGSRVSIVKPFTSLLEVGAEHLPVLQAGGHTPLGAALDLACAQLAKRRRFYKQAGIPAYRPWIVTLSDGAPNDDWQAPAAHVRRLAEQRHIVSLGVGVGPQADLATLGTFSSTDLPPRRLAGLRFGEFFRWLADSLRATSGSGDLRRAPIIANPAGWTQPVAQGSGQLNYWNTHFSP
jgi:Uncharacterized protein encoded in toxicity protection region of plasmid R478, contains von Willebrand factor (vWF) domain